MNTPSRGQWRGYALLCGILALLLIIALLLPLPLKPPSSDDNSQLAEAISLYADSILRNDSILHASRRNQYRHHYRHYYPRDIRNSSDSIHYVSSPRPKPISHYDTLLVDINTADTSRLQQLRGIGPVFATRIVRYRTSLGGFASVDQLLEVYGMSYDRFSDIAPHIVASPSNISKIPINSASLDQLRNHPYLDYHQARAIIEYRKKLGPIQNQDDLLKINLIDYPTARKISPYIQYNP